MTSDVRTFEITDEVDLPLLAAFIKAQLAPFDTTRLDAFELLAPVPPDKLRRMLSPRRRRRGTGRIRGLCAYPKPEAEPDAEAPSDHRGQVLRPEGSVDGSPEGSLQGYRIYCFIPEGTRFPCREDVPTGTKPLPSGGWRYTTQPVTFADEAELLAFVAGHEAFHFLHHSGQMGGRNTEPAANRYGLGWRYAWRIYQYEHRPRYEHTAGLEERIGSAYLARIRHLKQR